ncbi:MAG: hypothetical protein ACLTSL_14085 [Odoribacter splanchnicus]
MKSAFRSDRVVPLRIAQGETGKLVFTVAQGRCFRWRDQAGDTLAVFRLPDMIIGELGIFYSESEPALKTAVPKKRNSEELKKILNF